MSPTFPTLPFAPVVRGGSLTCDRPVEEQIFASGSIRARVRQGGGLGRLLFPTTVHEAGTTVMLAPGTTFTLAL